MSVAPDRLVYLRRRRGPDHDWFDGPPATATAAAWPDGSRMALCVAVALEFFPLDMGRDPLAVTGALDRPYPDLWSLSIRDYGLRVGIFRILDALARRGIPATALVNGEAAQRTPQLVAHLAERGWEAAAAGWNMASPHHDKLGLADERRLVQRTIEAVGIAAGSAPRGWSSPGHSQSSATGQLLTEAGLRYVLDWHNDDVPIALRYGAGAIHSLPTGHEWADRRIMVEANRTVDDYARAVGAAFARISREAEGGRRVFPLMLTPWIVGHPHRIAALETVLDAILASGPIWRATCSQVVDALVAPQPS